MGFQTAPLRYDQGFGVVGEIQRHSPHRATPGVIASNAVAANCIVGRFFTIDQATGAVSPGGVLSDTVRPYGILASPKQYASKGGATGPLSPTLQVEPAGTYEFLQMGDILVSSLTAAGQGDKGVYQESTGAIDFIAQSASPATGWAEIPNCIAFPLPQEASANGLVLARITN